MARSRGRGGTRGDDGVGRAPDAPQSHAVAAPLRGGRRSRLQTLAVGLDGAAGSWGPRRPRPRGAAAAAACSAAASRRLTAVAARSNRSFATPTRSAWNPARRQRRRAARASPARSVASVSLAAATTSGTLCPFDVVRGGSTRRGGGLGGRRRTRAVVVSVGAIGDRVDCLSVDVSRA